MSDAPSPQPGADQNGQRRSSSLGAAVRALFASFADTLRATVDTIRVWVEQPDNVRRIISISAIVGGVMSVRAFVGRISGEIFWFPGASEYVAVFVATLFCVLVYEFVRTRLQSAYFDVKRRDALARAVAAHARLAAPTQRPAADDETVRAAVRDALRARQRAVQRRWAVVWGGVAAVMFAAYYYTWARCVVEPEEGERIMLPLRLPPTLVEYMDNMAAIESKHSGAGVLAEVVSTNRPFVRDVLRYEGRAQVAETGVLFFTLYLAFCATTTLAFAYLSVRVETTDHVASMLSSLFKDGDADGD